MPPRIETVAKYQNMLRLMKTQPILRTSFENKKNSLVTRATGRVYVAPFASSLVQSIKR